MAGETLRSSAIQDDGIGGRSSSSNAVSSDPSLSHKVSLGRLNAEAPEFVPRTTNRVDLQQQQPLMVIPHGPVAMNVFPSENSPFHVQMHKHVALHNHVQYQYYSGSGEQESLQSHAPPDPDHLPVTRNGLSEEVSHKILNQVEYYFSDANLATTDHLMKFINKDPEGFVPISVVASFKKIKALISSNHDLVHVLQTSSKLVVSEDGKKVRRLHPLTESDMEELQSRIVIAENLPEDHSYQNLMKIFSAVGSVKTIRTCQPQTANGGSAAASRVAKMDNMFFSNKVHAFVEYKTVELAEKAIAELNDERKWRSGLRVRLLLRRKLKSSQARGRKAGHEAGGNDEEDEECTSEQPNDKQSEDSSQPSDAVSREHTGEEVVNDKENGPRRMQGRGRGKGLGWGQLQNNRGSHVGISSSNNLVQNEHQIVTKPPPGPRMPDGTRGFSMGRGKPIAAWSG
ncbi:la-related protein 6B-like [Telopea speciosissima]|uniref:la-related protein 6B-like n=1 Tax=Telopea speciosissima TaxID=54955 RepID=UPI001CC72018|nr:la-related protein 6B-like [Telopea speciosissima]